MNGFEELQNKSQINITEKNKEDQGNNSLKETEDSQKNSEEMIGNNEDEAAKMEIYSNPKAESGPLGIRSVFRVILRSVECASPIKLKIKRHGFWINASLIKNTCFQFQGETLTINHCSGMKLMFKIR